MAYIMVLKVLSFIGAILNTTGFLTFFIWPRLAPYRWTMIGGGIALIAISEILSHFFFKRINDNDGMTNGDEEI